MRQTRILVMDDHRLFVETLAVRLAMEPDIEVLPVAHDIKGMLAIAKTGRPDVVVLDLMLGSVSTVGALQDLLDRCPEARVIFLTAAQDVSLMVQAVRSGAVGWVPKSVGADQLIRVIRTVALGGGYIPSRSLAELLRRLTTGDEVAEAEHRLASLTQRERQVLSCMVDGLGRSQIAESLGVSVNTARTHTQNLLNKLEVHSALEAISLAMRAGLRPSVPAA
ncbi:response regulator transcription factor [Nonomuraea sediminis]|uniref:response regulator transcription factor n=1 Tax=Nonomuraea sediminis TaxID=2835864 RepID=UPI001BDC1F8F|nr:response regulator transcription factor [Nonomuraea sediminis]